MILNRKTTTALCLSALTLTACSGGGDAIAPIFAGDALITSADYVGKTFPIRYIAMDFDNAQVTRNTGSVRFISETELEVRIDGLNETVVEIAAGEFVGPTLDAQTLILSNAVTEVDGFTDSHGYRGFLGFETASVDIPMTNTFWYDSIDGSLLLLADGLVTDFYIGDTFLDVDFASGEVTGTLHSSEFAEFFITDGKITGNGITGGVVAFDDIGAITITGGDVDGIFYGNEAGVLAGTFEGTAALGVNVDFVGTFSGFKTIPDL